MYNLPAIMVITFPVAYLFGTLLATGRLSRDSEITALRACGTSFKRLTIPLILGSILVSQGNFLINDRLVPWANRQVVDLVRNLMLRQSRPVFKDNVFFKGEDDRYFYVKQVDQRTHQMIGVMVVDRHARPPETIVARTGTWSARRWELQDGVIHRYGSDPFVEREAHFDHLSVDVDQDPETFFTQGDLSPQEQTSAELGHQIETMKAGGVDTRTIEVDHHLKVSLPYATFFITLFAAPIGLRYARLGAFLGVAITIAVVFVYYIVMSIARSMGNAGMLDPMLAAWIQNVLFGIVGLWLIWRVDRSS
jgi:lipopolysaccharide export system permease protein